ncbi:MAG: helicase-exonuclease AddAB subunit AddA [Dialister sp.]|nr:helicase-exonuclease AddAB subunit AddA [Dialister sp.]
MSNITWTAEQEEALSLRHSSLLLSAAAGSGKTAVLTERIKRRLMDTSDQADVNELLVLTFTKAAAAEMKSRISSSLTKALEAAHASHDTSLAAHLEKQLSLMGTAQISTLDSFFQSLIRQYFYLLDMDPKTRIISDENEMYLLKEEVLSAVLERWYEKKDPSFQDCVDRFADRFQDTRLKATVLGIHDFSTSMPFPEEWIRSLPEPYRIPEDTSLDDLSWMQPVLDSLKSEALSICDSYRTMFDLVQRDPRLQPILGDMLSDEYQSFQAFESCQTWSSLSSIAEPLFKRMPSHKNKNAYPAYPTVAEFEKAIEPIRATRDKVKKRYTANMKGLLQVPAATWLSDMRAMYPIVTTLSALTLDFSRAFKERKKADAVMDFNDLEHYALDVLIDRENPDFSPDHAADFPSKAALALREKYKEVMIDEYQDTNGVQELIACLISKKDNRFMVGDIKQSIYRFRQADPTIFLEKYETYSLEPKSLLHRIDLNKNFRSDHTILSSINFLFRQFMTKSDTELNYSDAEALYAGRHEEPRPADYVGGSVDIDLIDQSEIKTNESPQELRELAGIEMEGRLIAQKIEAMVNGKQQVMNSDGSFRPIRYNDIVILLRSTQGKAPIILKALRDKNIPAVSDKEDDFMDSTEGRTLYSLLQILDNPRQDIPLAALLRSFFGGFSEEDLACLALCKRNRSDETLWDTLCGADPSQWLSKDKADSLSFLLQRLSVWRTKAKQDGVAPLIQLILEDTGFMTYVSALPGGVFRQAHVLALYQTALERDRSSGNSLFLFLDYLEKLHQSGRSCKSDVALLQESNAVRIMTIHKSKGLEFPVVFLSDTAKSFNKQDTSGRVICHKELGLGIQMIDLARHLRWPTLYYKAISETLQRESRAEEARLLYVAMTRARDKLIITGIKKNLSAELERWTIPLFEGTIKDCPTPLPSYLIAGASSYLDWIMPAAACHKTMADLWQLLEKEQALKKDAPSDEARFVLNRINQKDLLSKDELALLSEGEAIDEIVTGQGAVKDKAAVEKEKALAAFFTPSASPVPDWLSSAMLWTYPYEDASRIPAKMTATSALKLLQETADNAAEQAPLPSSVLAETLPDETAEDTSLSPDFAEPPLFLSENKKPLSGASYGMLIHKAMQALDFSSLPPKAGAVYNALQNLHDEGVFTDEEATVLLTDTSHRHPARDIARFLSSPLGKEAAAAEQLKKELPFSILLPAHTFYKNNLEDPIFLQGVIDCLFESSGQLTIVDYKTDHVSDGEVLASHYAMQLSIYGKAASIILGRPVHRLCLWSFHLGEAIEIKPIA